MVKNISNLGDAAVYCDFGSEVNEKINANVIDYFHHISKLIIIIEKLKYQFVVMMNLG